MILIYTTDPMMPIRSMLPPRKDVIEPKFAKNLGRVHILKRILVQIITKIGENMDKMFDHLH
jgi:hypothetical protein